MKHWYGLLFTTLISTTTAADQFQLPNYVEAEKAFWDSLYSNGGWTLYCGERFESNNNLVIEDIYPMEWAVEFLNCQSKEQCRAENAKFNRLESDLHNMYPAMQMVAQARKDYNYGVIAGEFRDFFECNFEYDVRDRIAEPRTIARGNIARSIFYMHVEYDLPIEQPTMELMQSWNREDPPSKDEIRRNELIEKIQGTRNPFIDNPRKAEVLAIPATEKRAVKDYRQAKIPKPISIF